jgi:hypothetical protein
MQKRTSYLHDYFIGFLVIKTQKRTRLEVREGFYIQHPTNSLGKITVAHVRYTLKNLTCAVLDDFQNDQTVQVHDLVRWTVREWGELLKNRTEASEEAKLEPAFPPCETLSCSLALPFLSIQGDTLHKEQRKTWERTLWQLHMEHGQRKEYFPHREWGK